jgi:hypothetical protein
MYKIVVVADTTNAKGCIDSILFNTELSEDRATLCLIGGEPLWEDYRKRIHGLLDTVKFGRPDTLDTLIFKHITQHNGDVIFIDGYSNLVQSDWLSKFDVLKNEIPELGIASGVIINFQGSGLWVDYGGLNDYGYRSGWVGSRMKLMETKEQPYVPLRAVLITHKMLQVLKRNPQKVMDWTGQQFGQMAVSSGLKCVYYPKVMFQNKRGI